RVGGPAKREDRRPHSAAPALDRNRRSLSARPFPARNIVQCASIPTSGQGAAVSQIASEVAQSSSRHTTATAQTAHDHVVGRDRPTIPNEQRISDSSTL